MEKNLENDRNRKEVTSFTKRNSSRYLTEFEQDLSEIHKNKIKTLLVCRSLKKEKSRRFLIFFKKVLPNNYIKNYIFIIITFFLNLSIYSY